MKHEGLVQVWENYKSKVQDQLRKPDNLIASSDQFRTKQEISELLDKGLSLNQKYGGDKGWKLSLRFNEETPGDAIEYRESVGGVHSGLSCLIKDDRWKPVEIIRRSQMERSNDYGGTRNGIEEKRYSLQNPPSIKTLQKTERLNEYQEDEKFGKSKTPARYHKTSSQFRPSSQMSSSLAKNPLVQKRF